MADPVWVFGVHGGIIVVGWCLGWLIHTIRSIEIER